MDPTNLWNRRANAGKLSLATDRNDGKDQAPPGPRRFGSTTSVKGGFSSSAMASPTTAGSSAFSLGSGAFASFGSAAKTPKTPGTASDFSKSTATTPGPTSEKKELIQEDKRATPRRSISYLRSGNATTPVTESAPAVTKSHNEPWSLAYPWVAWYRPPTSKNTDYEKSMQRIGRIAWAQDFWIVYSFMKSPSQLPVVSDYCFFKEGIRPVWEDDENKKGGKWTMRLKKGVADRYWEDLLMALVGDQFYEAREEVCGAVVSVKSGEDVISIWTKNDGGRNVKIRETVKRVLNLPPDTIIAWRSHDESITQRSAIDQARQERSQIYPDNRRNTLNQDSTPEKP